jgi:hypothetical protein
MMIAVNLWNMDNPNFTESAAMAQDDPKNISAVC